MAAAGAVDIAVVVCVLGGGVAASARLDNSRASPLVEKLPMLRCNAGGGGTGRVLV